MRGPTIAPLLGQPIVLAALVLHAQPPARCRHIGSGSSCVVGSPRPAASLRCASGHVRAPADAAGHPPLCEALRSLRSSGADCRPPCGRPLRTRWPVPVAESAPGCRLYCGRSKSTAPPAGQAQGRKGSFVLRVACWVVRPGWPSPSPGPGGNQEPAGSATGGGVVWLRVVLLSPVALPAEPWSGFACQARGTTNLSTDACAALNPGPALGPAVRCKIVHRKHPPAPDHPSRAATGKNPPRRTTPPKPHGEISHRVLEPILAAQFHLKHPARTSRQNLTSSARPKPRGIISPRASNADLKMKFRVGHRA